MVSPNRLPAAVPPALIVLAVPIGVVKGLVGLVIAPPDAVEVSIAPREDPRPVPVVVPVGGGGSSTGGVRIGVPLAACPLAALALLTAVAFIRTTPWTSVPPMSAKILPDRLP